MPSITFYLKSSSGLIDTDIWRNMPFPLSFFFDLTRKNFLKTIEEGMQTTLYAMMSPELEGITGQYLVECKIAEPRADVHKKKWQNALWIASKEIVGLTENDPQI